MNAKPQQPVSPPIVTGQPCIGFSLEDGPVSADVRPQSPADPLPHMPWWNLSDKPKTPVPKALHAMAQAVASKEPNVVKGWEIFQRLTVGAMLLAMATLVKCVDEMHDEIQALQVWSAQTEGSRFRASDGLALNARMDAMRESLSKELATIRLMIPSQIPPEWFRDQVEKLTNKVDNMSERLIRVEDAVRKNGR